jgi:hypothetical protein
MGENLSNFLCGSFSLAVGAMILHNLDALVRFDKVGAWLNKRLGKSVLTRELWTIKTANTARVERIVLQVVAVIALLAGLVMVGLAFQNRFY